MKRILIIAGSDSSGGAGAGRDCIVAHEYGLRSQTVITAVTAQGRDGVCARQKIPPQVIAAQLRTAWENGPPDVVKIGMLGWKSTVDQVASMLEGCAVPVVLDPVLRTTSGGQLLTARGRAALLKRLLPLVRLITPNLEEAAILSAIAPDGSLSALRRQAGFFLGNGAGAVLIKGGHATGDLCCDHLFAPGQHQEFGGQRLGMQCRGTGCTLATAIACELALGLGLPEACRQGHGHTRKWIMKNGHAPPQRGADRDPMKTNRKGQEFEI